MGAESLRERAGEQYLQDFRRLALDIVSPVVGEKGGAAVPVGVFSPFLAGRLERADRNVVSVRIPE